MTLSPIKRLFVLVAAASLLLSGCFGQKKPEEQLYEVMEQAVKAEKPFEAQQKPLVELETKEKEIFDRIMGIGQKDMAQVEKLSNEAIDLAEKRKEHIGKERDSLGESQKQFKKALDIKKKIKDPKLKDKADLLYSTMTERYAAHEKLYKEYLIALEGDEELYNSLKSKNVKLEDLENQVTKVNASYSKVLKANEKFNELTEKYNNEKLSFYEMAGLDKEKS